MVGASDPAWLQGAFSALVAIFDRVGLQKNVDKTVSMACHPCWAGSGNRTTEGYRQRVMGDGNSFREQQQERVACGDVPDRTIMAIGKWWSLRFMVYIQQQISSFSTGVSFKMSQKP